MAVMPKKPPYVATVELEARFGEKRYFRDGMPLVVTTKGRGSSVPVAITRAVRLVFKHHALKHKSPTYIDMSVRVTSRWLMDGIATPKLQ